MIPQALARLCLPLVLFQLGPANPWPRTAAAGVQELPAGDRLAAVKKLYAEHRWADILRLVPAAPDLSPELDYYRGMALAHLERWQEAKEAFEFGRRNAPRDKRFPVELAGIAFKQEKLREAKADLRRALNLDPHDAYAIDFLATIYSLEGNLEAALKVWNRIEKPRIEDVRLNPRPRVDPGLLDRAFAFSPATVLRLDDLLTSEARIDNLDVFPRYHFDLSARQDDQFDLTFRPAERDGWGTGKAEAAVSVLRGLPYQTVYPEFYNLKQSATNFVSLARWDAQKRRAFASLSGPWMGNPKWRYRLHLDGRDENWDLSRTAYGPARPTGDLKLKWVEAGADIVSAESGRWSWRSGVNLSYRDFGNFPVSQAETFFIRGFALKYDAGLDVHALRVPQRRFTLDTTASGALGKILASSSDPFAKLSAGVRAHWLPESRGDDYETTLQFRAGKTLGQPPFDELFILGIERDNDLWLRAHVGTRDGKKGSAPLGRDYLLFNGDVDKTAYQNGFLKLKLGPWLDSGRIYDSSGSFGSKVWLWDTGGRLKVGVTGGPTVMFVYGKDLRSGSNAYYVTVSR